MHMAHLEMAHIMARFHEMAARRRPCLGTRGGTYYYYQGGAPGAIRQGAPQRRFLYLPTLLHVYNEHRTFCTTLKSYVTFASSNEH